MNRAAVWNATAGRIPDGVPDHAGVYTTTPVRRTGYSECLHCTILPYSVYKSAQPVSLSLHAAIRATAQQMTRDTGYVIACMAERDNRRDLEVHITWSPYPVIEDSRWAGSLSVEQIADLAQQHGTIFAPKTQLDEAVGKLRQYVEEKCSADAWLPAVKQKDLADSWIKGTLLLYCVAATTYATRSDHLYRCTWLCHSRASYYLYSQYDWLVRSAVAHVWYALSKHVLWPAFRLCVPCLVEAYNLRHLTELQPFPAVIDKTTHLLRALAAILSPQHRNILRKQLDRIIRTGCLLSRIRRFVDARMLSPPECRTPLDEADEQLRRDVMTALLHMRRILKGGQCAHEHTAGPRLVSADLA